ncbi:hypothetical protein PsorP6_010147 [Peronosclerospora sorghi]|uniref:Uncharacterized protein n=1 Tax=Peronosclerospora sorghi TaxID=230839 RepID=A0ACC0VW45_9STRA|nr:hypothetical protein PsorP6_010147 [Peronosclerospora sorghi]
MSTDFLLFGLCHLQSLRHCPTYRRVASTTHLPLLLYSITAKTVKEREHVSKTTVALALVLLLIHRSPSKSTSSADHTRLYAFNKQSDSFSLAQRI